MTGGVATEPFGPYFVIFYRRILKVVKSTTVDGFFLSLPPGMYTATLFLKARFIPAIVVDVFFPCIFAEVEVMGFLNFFTISTHQ